MFSKIKHTVGGPAGAASFGRRRMLIPVLFAAVFVCGLVLTGCPSDPEGKSGSRDTIPDLKREIFVINGLAETLSIVNPEAVRNPDGEIGADEYIDNGNSVSLEKKRIYHDALLVGASPTQVLHYDGKLYVINSLDNLIDVYDESTFSWKGEIDLGTGSNPWMMVRKEGSSKGYVTNFTAGDVAVVDLDSYKVLERIDAGQGPEGLAYVNDRVFVCNTNYSQEFPGFGRGTVTVIDTETDTVEKTVDIEDAGYVEGEGSNPQSAVAFGAPINEVHIICTGNNGGDEANDGEIVVIDASSGGNFEIKERVWIGGSPIYSAGSVDEVREIVYLSGVGGLQAYKHGDGTAGSIEVLHDSSGYIVEGIDIAFDFFSGTVYDEENDLIFVTLFTDDKVIALDGDPGSYEKLAEFTAGDGVQSPVLVSE